MATLNLQALTKDDIESMGLTTHDLWMIKIDQDLFGPFESESLKNYSSQNEDLFDDALASKVDNHDFRPFWSHALFQRRSPQLISRQSHKGPFWILNQGQKTGPFTFQEIEKKLEIGALTLTDHISSNNGGDWTKVHEWNEFDRREQAPRELPQLPTEESFQNAKIILIDKLEGQSVNETQDQLVEMTYKGQHMAKVLTLKLDELTLQSLNKSGSGFNLKWIAPGAAAILLTMITSIYLMFSPNTEENLTANYSANSYATPRSAASPNPSVNLGRQRPGAQIPQPRQPASIGPSTYAPRPQSSPRFPTHIETHEDIQHDEPMEADQHELPTEPVVETEAPARMEHSLVNNGMPEEQSLDAAMNGSQEPVVEEASDF